jgi:hypothetical protein
MWKRSGGRRRREAARPQSNLIVGDEKAGWILGEVPQSIAADNGNVLSQPVGQFLTIAPAGCNRQDDPMLLGYFGDYLAVVQIQKDFHRRVAGALISIDERVILNN